MRIGWRGLFCSILLRCLAESRERFWPLNERASEDDSLADIVRKVLRGSPTRDVLLIVRDSSSDGGRADDILAKISAATARRVPTFYVNARQVEPEFQISSCALSRDLLVYIYVSQREPDIVEGELVADDLRSLVHTHGRPKVLVLMILRQSALDLAAFFQTIWSRRILSAIVVEHCRSNEHSTTIHRYDPFTDTLTAEPYSANTTEWFTDDFPDMHGYPLVYAYNRRPPYSDMILTSTGEIYKLRGVDQMVIQALADKMNFSHVVKLLTHNIYTETFPNGTTIGIISELNSGKYEALLNTLPMFEADVHFADSCHVETWCFVVPRLSTRHNFFNHRGIGIRLFFASFSIVVIFWLYARLTRLDLNRWHPLRIVGIMLTSSFPPAPTRLHERIVFLSIFVACARYSSNLLSELMSLRTLESDHYVRFDHLSDLINSHLTLMTLPQMVDMVTQDDEFLKSHAHDNKVESFLYINMCLEDLLVHQNVSCFMERGWANLAAVNNMQDGQSMLRITKLCYLSVPTGYIFSRGSPYVRRVSELLLMLSESGIRDKWQRDYLRNETREMSEDKMVDRNRMDVGMFRPMLCVLEFGYLLSVLVFIGELIWKRLESRLRRTCPL